MSDTDSTAGESTEPIELPIHQAETPAQKKEFGLGFEYGTELIQLETDLRKKIARIRSLEHPIGNQRKTLHGNASWRSSKILIGA